jgi:hypothetical protein
MPSPSIEIDFQSDGSMAYLGSDTPPIRKTVITLGTPRPRRSPEAAALWKKVRENEKEAEKLGKEARAVELVQSDMAGLLNAKLALERDAEKAEDRLREFEAICRSQPHNRLADPSKFEAAIRELADKKAGIERRISRLEKDATASLVVDAKALRKKEHELRHTANEARAELDAIARDVERQLEEAIRPLLAQLAPE